MKIPKIKGGIATIRANEHPEKLKKGGRIKDKDGEVIYPKGFNPDSLQHFLGPNEKPLTGDQMAELGYKLGKGEDEYVSPTGDYLHYKPITPGTTAYNIEGNPHYVKPQAATSVTEPAFKPKYPSVYDKEAWAENQKTIAALRAKKTGETFKKGGKIKGYVAGGSLIDAPIKSKTRDYSNTFGANLHDFAAFNLDNVLATVGAGNIIKEEDYKTKVGAKTGNQLNYGVQKIGPGIAAAIGNYFMPGVGDLQQTIVKGIEAGTGEDKGLDPETSKTQAKVGAAIDKVSTLTSGLNFGKNKKKDKDKNTDIGRPEQGLKDDSSFENMVDKDIESGVFKGDNTISRTAIPTYRDYDAFAAELSDDEKLQFDLMTDQEKDEYMNSNRGLAKGGKIKGAGTGTSDSIPAKMEEGGFVVPAKNAKVAEQIREEYLASDGERTAPLKSGNKKVKVSDGEHYFTKEEAEYLTSQGVDLNALAPEAENKMGMQKGGKVGDKPKRKNSTGNAKVDKMIDEAYANPNLTKKELKEIHNKAKILLGVTGIKSAIPKLQGAVLNDFDTYVAKKSQTETATKNIKAGKDKYNRAVQNNIKILKRNGANEEEIESFKNRLKNYPTSGPLNPAPMKEVLSKVKDRTEKQTVRKNADNNLLTAQKKTNEALKAWNDARENPENYTADQIEKLRNNFDNISSVNNFMKSKYKKSQFEQVNRFAKNSAVSKALGASKNEEIKPITYDLGDEDAKAATKEKASEQPKFTDPNVVKNRPKLTGDGSSLEEMKAGKAKAQNAANSLSQIKGGKKVGGKAGSGIINESGALKADGTRADKAYEDMTFEEKKEYNKMSDPDFKMGKKDVKLNSIFDTPDQPKKTIPGEEDTPEGEGEEKKFKFDGSKAFSAYQIGEGLRQLTKDGPRPVDALAGDYLASVEKAKAEAKFGISPLERERAERLIERNRRARTEDVIGLSGGSAGTALANIRASGLQADESAKNLSIDSEKLRLQKQRYADQMVAGKQEKSRRLFEDKLNAFQQNQMAGAQLLGAGIQNIVGAGRYDKELAAQKEREAIGKSVNPEAKTYTKAGIQALARNASTDKSTIDDDYYRAWAKKELGVDYDKLT